MYRIKLVNKTAWDTEDIKTFFIAGLKARGVPAEGIWDTTASIARKGEITGYAFLNHKEFTICFLPRGKRKRMAASEMRTAGQVLLHEIDHCIGLEHKDMLWYYQLEVKWVASVPPIRARLQNAAK